MRHITLEYLIHLISNITDANPEGKKLDFTTLTKAETKKLLEYLKELQKLKQC